MPRRSRARRDARSRGRGSGCWSQRVWRREWTSDRVICHQVGSAHREQGPRCDRRGPRFATTRRSRRSGTCGPCRSRSPRRSPTKQGFLRKGDRLRCSASGSGLSTVLMLGGPMVTGATSTSRPFACSIHGKGSSSTSANGREDGTTSNEGAGAARHAPWEPTWIVLLAPPRRVSRFVIGRSARTHRLRAVGDKQGDGPLRLRSSNVGERPRASLGPRPGSQGHHAVLHDWGGMIGLAFADASPGACEASRRSQHRGLRPFPPGRTVAVADRRVRISVFPNRYAAGTPSLRGANRLCSTDRVVSPRL